MPILIGMITSANTSSIHKTKFAKVALPVPVATLFTYEVPENLRSSIAVGSRVEVPFGRRVLSGIVVELAVRSEVERTKPIRALYETFMSQPLLRLTEWIASYYGCSVGEAAQSVLPPLLKRARRREAINGLLEIGAGVTGEDVAKSLSRARRQRELAEKLLDAGGRANVRTVIDEWGFTPLVAQALVDRGMATIRKQMPSSPLDEMETVVRQLNPDQVAALEKIQEDLDTVAFSPVLLQGVTGSGKTELYLRAARAVVNSGGGCIVLVPEIGLIPQATSRYRRVFGDDIAILHSRLSGAERFRIWERVERGQHRVVLGPRSAIFSPVQNLRLIIVDEEQDDSYKQDDKPRYHARNVALMRGKFENATVVLGSATPSAETLHHARGGLYRHLKLPSRVKGSSLPTVRIIDMRTAEMNGAFFSSALLESLQKTLDAGHQSILFLNKRGHARYVLCNACGWVARCQNCDISLTYHRIRNRLRCHFCGYDRKSVTRCDQCSSSKLYFSGVGTQRVELDLEAFFPGIGILRMDADTTSGKDGHRRVLEKFGSGHYRILIGTQMVTKGHHFPRVNLVGVLFGEESLNYPDFRSSEKTFQQLIQVSGRSGRDSDRGEVIVQTYMPEHYVFNYLTTHDFDGFMSEELAVREGLGYPPFCRLILASCSATKEGLVATVINAWAAHIEPMLAGRPVQVLGPVQPTVARIKNRYREQLLIRGQISNHDKALILNAYSDVVDRIKGGRSVELRWDVDPEAFL